MGLQEDKFAYKAVKPHDNEERKNVKNVSSIDKEEACETSTLKDTTTFFTINGVPIKISAF